MALAERPLGIDISHHQGTITPAKWAQIHDAGRVFCFARASYGWGGLDTQFADNMVNGRAAGLYMGAYHFSYAGYSVNHTPVNEANTFLSVARNYITAGYMRPVLDVEYIGPYLGSLTLSQWVNQWMDIVEQETGVEPLIYTNLNYALNYLDSSVKSRDLWIAAWWTNPDPQTDNPSTDGFATWRFWQYSSTGSVAGISPLDLDVFNGTLAQLQSFVIGSGALPTISRAPSTLSPTVVAGLEAANQVFTVSNSGQGTLSYTITEEIDWLSVNPAGGTSTGEADTITVTYATASMGIGTYTGTISIADSLATNSPQSIEVTLTVRPAPCDFDADGHVDEDDILVFKSCLTGPGNPWTDPACEAEDLDHDSDVDQADCGRLQGCLKGPFEPADPYCGS